MLEIMQTDEFVNWLRRLRDADAKARLIGGDKSSQQKDIVKAKKLNQEYE